MEHGEHVPIIGHVIHTDNISTETSHILPETQDVNEPHPIQPQPSPGSVAEQQPVDVYEPRQQHVSIKRKHDTLGYMLKMLVSSNLNILIRVGNHHFLIRKMKRLI